MKNKLKILSLTIVMFGVIPSVFAQGFWQRLGQAVLGVAAGAAEGYVGSTLNDQDRQAWNDISNDINNGLGLNNGYVNAGNKLQEGETRDAVVNMGVTAASNSGNRTLITVSNTVKAQNDYVNNVSSGMDRKTAQEVAAKQISDVWLDDMEERERVANERKKEEYNTTKTEIYSAPSRTENNAPSKTEYKEVSSMNSNNDEIAKSKAELRMTFSDISIEYWNRKEEYKQLVANGTSGSILKYKKDSLDALSQRMENLRHLLGDESIEIQKKNANLQAKLRATLSDLSIEYWNKNEEYKQLVSNGVSSSTLKYKKETLDMLSRSMRELRRLLEEQSNEILTKKFNLQAELRATFSDMSIEYWNKNEEYKQLVASGTSNTILKYKKESLDRFSKILEVLRQLLEK